MKRILLLSVLVIFVLSLTAQEIAPWQYLRHSAVTPDNSVHFRFDSVIETPSIYEFYYKIGTTDWQMTTPELISDLTYDTAIPYQMGQAMQYRMKGSTDYMGQQIAVLNPAFLTQDTFPPALSNYAYVCDDPVGDSIMIYTTATDITGSWSAFSDNRFYAAVSNQANSFPTMISINTYNLYLSAFINPETALTDSVMYAMVYTVNLPGVISPGLYKIGIDANQQPVFQRLGNIQSQVSGGKLYMSCLISDLIADASFGEWPNVTKTLIQTCASMRISVDLSTMTPTFSIGDYSNPAALIFEHYLYQRSTNNLPVLSDFQYIWSSDVVHYQVTYYDSDADFPLISKIIFSSNGNTETADLINLTPDYSQPQTFSVDTEIWGWNSLSVVFSDDDSNMVNLDVNVSIAENISTPNPPICQIVNPVRNSLSSEVSLHGLKVNNQVKVSLYNLKGQKIGCLNFTANSLTKSISLHDITNHKALPNGVYLLKAQQGNQYSIKKISVIR